MPRHLLQILDLSPDLIHALLQRSRELKQQGREQNTLQGQSYVLVFEKASTRTRISFEVAVSQLGGTSIFMTPQESQLGRSEPLKDTARVLSRYCQGMIVRTFAQQSLEELAAYSDIPVINALSDRFHPCQVLSDLLTIQERSPDFSRLKMAWIGDGNNMAHSWINAACFLPFYLHLAIPQGFEPDTDILERALQAGAKVNICHDPRDALQDADYIHTDVWASMGQEGQKEARNRPFTGFQLNQELLSQAPDRALVMHCLPAHRGEEITEEVLEGDRSIVWDQAENRLHMQKALLQWVAGGI
ncbi:MAG: ornithine carbamoyltransferase [Thermodesulfobacteriota bacterium]